VSAGLLVVLADAAAATGVGHYVRSAALATELASRGWSVAVAGQPDTVAWVLDDVRSRGWAVLDGSRPHELAPLVAAATGVAGPAALLVDSYRVDAAWLRRARDTFPGPLAVIDDVGERALPGDLVLNQNVGAEELRLSTDPGAVVLRGLRHALLRPEITAAREAALADPRPEQPNRVLVVMGGTDPTGSAPLVAAACARALPSARVLVVAPDGAVPPAERVRSVPRIDDMAGGLRAADLVVTAAGSTLWEAFCLGRPVAAVEVAANQSAVYRRLVADGVVIGLGSAPLDEDAVASRLLAGLAGPGRSRGLADAGARMVDGRGAERVAREIENVTKRWSDARG
jgi:spore coat polysaccharide biosynthesis predicted glycosyltransferase SpsG